MTEGEGKGKGERLEALNKWENELQKYITKKNGWICALTPGKQQTP